MNDDEIISIWTDVLGGVPMAEALKMLARTVETKTIERCAEVCDSLERKKWETVRDGGKLDGFSAKDCAAAIRAMKNDPVA